MNVRPGLCKSKPTTYVELLKQPVFGNPLITNQENRPLGFSGRSEGNAFANADYSRVRDFWDSKMQG
jgi:sensor domain CHASE-containing protein